jgi:ArsR family metal-binding transcriptional regulator
MTRAVIELAHDISPAIEVLSQKVERCTYNPKVHSAFFMKEEMIISMYPKEITILRAENEAAAGKVMEWLQEVAFEDQESGG